MDDLEACRTELRLSRGQLKETRELLKMSMSDKTRIRVQKHIERLIEYEAEYQQAIGDCRAICQRHMEVETLATKQELLIERLKHRIGDYEEEIAKHKDYQASKELEIDKLKGMLEEIRSKLSQSNEQAEKFKNQGEISKEQNKRLVELLGKMEKKNLEKEQREEFLEDQCLQLREALTVMTGQVERMENDLEKKVKDKEKQARKLQQRVDMLEREKKIREDADELRKQEDEY